MTMDRLRTMGFVLAFLITGVVVFSLYGAFKGAIEGGNWVAFLGGILLGAVMVGFLLIVMIVPDRRATGWVRAVTNINAKYLFGFLIVAWIATMGLLASFELPANTVGAPALLGMFAGIFIFMGFIWAVIGE
jgi:hypothetical protein